MRQWSERSLDNLTGIHPDLLRVVSLALQTCPIDYSVIEGRRTLERQKLLVARGASKTMNSRHRYGMAVDLWPIEPATGRSAVAGTPAAEKRLWELLRLVAAAAKQEATRLKIPLTWGGDWTTFPDGPHFELPHALYPNEMRYDPLPPDTFNPPAPEPEAPPVVASAEPEPEPELPEGVEPVTLKLGLPDGQYQITVLGGQAWVTRTKPGMIV